MLVPQYVKIRSAGVTVLFILVKVYFFCQNKYPLLIFMDLFATECMYFLMRGFLTPLYFYLWKSVLLKDAAYVFNKFLSECIFTLLFLYIYHIDVKYCQIQLYIRFVKLIQYTLRTVCPRRFAHFYTMSG